MGHLTSHEMGGQAFAVSSLAGKLGALHPNLDPLAAHVLACGLQGSSAYSFALTASFLPDCGLTEPVLGAAWVTEPGGPCRQERAPQRADGEGLPPWNSDARAGLPVLGHLWA